MERPAGEPAYAPTCTSTRLPAERVKGPGAGARRVVFPEAVRVRRVLRSSALLLALTLTLPGLASGAPQGEAEVESSEAAGAGEASESAELAPAPEPTPSHDHVASLEALSARADAIERRMKELAERVLLLRETVVTGKVAPTQALVVHRNDLGSSFRMEQVVYTLDGREIFARDDNEGFLDGQREFELVNGALPAGEHELKVSLVIGGSGFGLFTYLKGYRFKVESRYRFVVAEGRLTRLSVIAYEKPDITLEPKDRLAVRYDLEVGSVPSATGR